MAENLPDKTLADALEQAEIVTSEQLEAARAAQTEQAEKGLQVSLGDVLVQQGIVTPVSLANISKKIQSQQSGDLQQLGRYKVIKKMGEGGMGAVYLGEDVRIGRKVALKVLPRKFAANEQFVTRFRQEAKAMAQLRHPNITTLYDMGEEDGILYMATEYVEGTVLSHFMSSANRPATPVLLRILSAIAGALHHAHERGILHRDVKPANILIGLSGVPMLVDFGLSKDTGNESSSFHTQPGVAMGTPHYISPEQAKGEKQIDSRTDIYSFGATMFQVLSGKTPFLGNTAPVIMMKHLTEPLDVSPLMDRVPEYVVTIIERCMKKDPKDRYASAADLQQALEAALATMESSTCETIVQAAPRAGQLLLLHVEHHEASLPGSYREYEVTGRINEGSFGEVYQAREKLSGQDVALKILKREWVADAEMVKRFRREAAMLASLSHPNVVRVFNYGRYGQTFFVAMELLTGSTLDQVRRKRRTLPVAEALPHVLGILKGLDAVHTAGIVHRDLKPANVQVMGDRVVLIDFGLAYAQDLSRMTLSGMFVGTVAYAAPEQVMGETVTGKADVYAAGVILYELLTGHLPHEADSLVALQHKKISEAPTPITKHRRDLSTALIKVIHQMLDTDPEARPSAAEAIERLSVLRG